VAGVWLENDGDPATQDQAAARPGWTASGPGARAEAGGWTIWHGAGRRALDGAGAACATHDLVILSEPAPAGPLSDAAAPLLARLIAAEAALALTRADPCLVIDAALLSATGALALAPAGDTLTVTTARMAQGHRPWAPPLPRAQ
jgi:competence protein ComEC